MVIFHVEKPKTPGYAVEVEDSLLQYHQVTEVEEKIDIAAFMAMGDVLLEKKFLKNVQLVILLIKVEQIKLVLHLYNVVGRKVGAVSDYKYSKALALMIKMDI